MSPSRWFPFALALVLPSCGEPSSETPIAPCNEAAPAALRACVADYSAAIAACYEDTDAPCGTDDPALAAALEAMDASLAASCSTDDPDASFGALDLDALPGRLRNACASEASSLAWRTYGGPQGSVWPSAGGAGQACLADAHASVATMVDASLTAVGDCLAGEACDAPAVADTRAMLEADAIDSVETACTDLASLVGLDPAAYVERAALQVDCLAATAHPDAGDLGLRCGPSHAQFDAPRGEWKQVIVDSDEWGTMCGDGSPYAFQIRLAPEGAPLDRVIIGLQGGGVCLLADDCKSRFESSPDLFMATDDVPVPIAVMSDDPEVSPFADYTKVYLPYCTQDVFAGGGVDEEFSGGLTVARYGSVNVRAAVRMVRDVLWREMDAAGGAGFRPDELVALFGGWSAGGYGALYNYHWLLDDLQWPRTVGFPDAGIGLDTGDALGVAALGVIKIPVWDTTAQLPPYCFDGSCAEGDVLFEAISPRLMTVPQQQILPMTNPFDLTQQGDAFFSDTPQFINRLRASYCATKDLPGINHYYTSVSDESVHVISVRPDLWSGEVDGETLRDFMLRAVTDGESVVDRVEEADFVSVFPGVDPYPCAVAP
jgi:hypothetical protein